MGWGNGAGVVEGKSFVLEGNPQTAGTLFGKPKIDGMENEMDPLENSYFQLNMGIFQPAM